MTGLKCAARDAGKIAGPQHVAILTAENAKLIATAQCGLALAVG
jgi:hypothetical protein